MSLPYRFTAVLATLALAAGGASAFADGGGNNNNNNATNNVLQTDLFGSMPTGPTLFGVKPGGAPWSISKGTASVRRDGRVDITIEGLVIPTAPQNGTNPVNGLAATVYCNGAASGTTHVAAFSTAGNAQIHESLAKPLPSPCLAPTVLINPAPGGAVVAGTYIAASGE
jgi:hypothetical protein